MWRLSLLPLMISVWVMVSIPDLVWAHHVLGRPAYSLSEDSNTPPSMQLEVQLGHYTVTVMAFPAFPKVGQDSRIRLYASHLDSGEPFLGEVTFSIRDDVWFAGESEVLGVQIPTDGIYRQVMVFAKEGDYLVTAQFEAGGEPYIVDLPIRIGNPPSYLPLVVTFAVLGFVMLALAYKKRVIRRTREERSVRVADRQRPAD